jgi:hypothetical protein
MQPEWKQKRAGMPCSEHRGWVDDVRGRVGHGGWCARLDGSARHRHCRHRLTLFCPGAGVQELEMARLMFP